MNIEQFFEGKEHIHNIALSTKQDLADYLKVTRMLNEETSKAEADIDGDLLKSCFAYMQELVEPSILPDDEALTAKLNQIKSRATAAPQPTLRVVTKKPMRRIYKVLIAATITLTLLFTTLTITAKQQG